jgi:tyrosyl-tRNA synthetase
MKNTFDILKERGFVEQVSDEDALRKAFDEGPVTAYIGYDPSGESLHVGNLLSLVMLRHLIEGGHHAIAVLGGGTALVGDPSGKDEMRKLLTRDAIRANFEKIKPQIERILGHGRGKLTIVDNAEWLENLNYVEFLRDIGRHFSVNRMLAAEAYKVRMEKGLSFLEFNYQVLQSYDFLVLFREHGCRLQMGGNDQWGNILAGADLIRRVEAAEAWALTCPLLTTASGAKMGKTEKGAIWLDAEMLSPYEFFQYWRNADDRDVSKLLRFYTFLPLDEVAEAEKAEGAELNKWKERLAFEVTKLVHNEAEADDALKSARELFTGKADSLEGVPTLEISASDLEKGYWITTAATAAGLVPTKAEASRLVKQGGLYLNDKKITDPRHELKPEDFKKSNAILRAGKKKYARIILK